MDAQGLLLMVFVILIGTFFVVCALSWLLPSQVSKIIQSTRTSYGTIDRRKEKKREPLKMAFCIVSFIGWFLIYNNALYGLLTFLPDEWGGKDEYGDWISYRSGIAGTASFWLSIFTLVRLEKLNAVYMAYNATLRDIGNLNP